MFMRILRSGGINHDCKLVRLAVRLAGSAIVLMNNAFKMTPRRASSELLTH